MAKIQAIKGLTYAAASAGDVSAWIAPPYDVLDEPSKAALLRKSEHNIAAVDLPHLPAKTVGPDEAYASAGRNFSQWRQTGVLARSERAALYVYRQTFGPLPGQATKLQRLGLIANVQLRPFGEGVYPHERTFPDACEDRLKLMRATGVQLSPIFGFYLDAEQQMQTRLAQVAAGPPSFCGRTDGDGVLHEVWAVEDNQRSDAMITAWADRDVFIADGHHRYTTALNYQAEQVSAGTGQPGADHCMFVLVAVQDPGMVVLPTHRVIGGMHDFSMRRLREASSQWLQIETFDAGSLAELEAALPSRRPHGIGLFHPDDPEGPMSIATTIDSDPLSSICPDRKPVWRQLDVAIVESLILDTICRPNFARSHALTSAAAPAAPASPSTTNNDDGILWKFPHTLDQVQQMVTAGGFQLGIILQPVSIDAVSRVSEAGELMPQKSTFFYPKLATGLIINPLFDPDV